MNATALARPGIEDPAVRGFNFADMQRHGRWVMPRLLKAFPHLDQRQMECWLRGVMPSPEYLMRYQDHSVALAQVLRSQANAVEAVVHEIFVWCEDPEDKEQQREASEFYSEFAIWAHHLGCKTVMVDNNSDVPQEMIKEKLGRLFERKQWFARV